jgi:hypothetical protein
MVELRSLTPKRFDEHIAIGEGDAQKSVHAMWKHVVRMGTTLLAPLAQRSSEKTEPNWAERFAIPFAS